MFTGIVQALGIVLVATEVPAGKRLTVSLAELVDAPIGAGDSVCVSGVCLTVVKQCNGTVHFDVVEETLRRTTLGGKKAQDRVNLELSMRADSLVGGHFVQGHVDGVATVVGVNADPHDWRVTFEVPGEMGAYLVPKGSVAVDGVSMTIAESSGVGGGVKGKGQEGRAQFTLAVIPTTLERTTLSGLSVGDKVNVETDILARTVVHCVRQMREAIGVAGTREVDGAGGGAAAAEKGEMPGVGGITVAKLRELGLL